MPVGLLDTVPVPVPTSATVRVKLVEEAVPQAMLEKAEVPALFTAAT